MTKPNINITPLIDVLLVLLIIFMVYAPARPKKFEAKIPEEPKELQNFTPNPNTLIVTVNPDNSLRVNLENDLGTVGETGKLIARLREIFRYRLENQIYNEKALTNPELSEIEKVEKTVFIKAPTGLDYGSVVKVVDAVKTAGAGPIGLQINGLN